MSAAGEAVDEGTPRTCRCAAEKPHLRFNPSNRRPLWLCDSHASQMDKGHVFDVVPMDPTDQATGGEAQGEDVRTLWRIGDAWRNFLPEINGSTGAVWAVTARGSVRVLNVSEGWQLRVPEPGGAFILGDRMQGPLSEVSVATPCGITTWGNGPTTWSSSMAVLLLATGLPDASPAIPAGLTEDVVAESFSAHPAGTCGALHCQHGGDRPQR